MYSENFTCCSYSRTKSIFYLSCCQWCVFTSSVFLDVSCSCVLNAVCCRMETATTQTVWGSRGFWRLISRAWGPCSSMDPPILRLLSTKWQSKLCSVCVLHLPWRLKVPQGLFWSPGDLIDLDQSCVTHKELPLTNQHTCRIRKVTSSHWFIISSSDFGIIKYLKLASVWVFSLNLEPGLCCRGWKQSFLWPAADMAQYETWIHHSPAVLITLTLPSWCPYRWLGSAWSMTSSATAKCEASY